MFLSKALNHGYQAQRCQICNKSFSLLTFSRIHKCKRCERYICSTCGKNKQFVLNEEGIISEKQHRICLYCKQQLININEIIINYGIKWACSSNFCFSWLSKIQYDPDQYDQHITLYYQNKQIYDQSYKIIQKDVFSGRTDLSVFNYSMKNFFYIIQKNKTKDGIRRNVANVLFAISTKYTNLGYCQGMNAITAFLLCFGNQKQAYIIFCDLIEKILPQNLYSKSSNGTNLIGLIAQNYFLKEYTIQYTKQNEQIQFEEAEIQKLKIVIQLMASKCIITLFVNTLTFSNLIYVWNQLKSQRSFEVIQKIFLSIMILFIKNPENRSNNFANYEKFITMLNLKQLKQQYNMVNIDKQRKKILISKFYEDFSKQWNNSSNYGLRKLSNFTKFKQDQLKNIQSHYNNFIQKKKQKNKKNGNQLKKQGMTKIEYIDFVLLYDQQIQLSQVKFADDLKTQYLQKLFEVFDEQKDGFLDFRQFICCLSMNLRGNLKEKLNILLQTLKYQNGIMNKIQFKNFIYTIIQTIHSTEIKFTEQVKQLEQNFKQRVNKVYSEDQNISISQLYILVNDPYISQATLNSVVREPQAMTECICKILNRMIQSC